MCPHKGIQVDPTKVEVIVNLAVPTSQKAVTSFLGHAGYYRHFIDIFTRIYSPMFKLLANDAKLSWDEQLQTTFGTLIKRLYSTPILRGPNWTIHFHIPNYAYDSSIGAVLGQQDDMIRYSIYYMNKNLNPIESNYIITET